MRALLYLDVRPTARRNLEVLRIRKSIYDRYIGIYTRISTLIYKRIYAYWYLEVLRIGRGVQHIGYTRLRGPN